MSELLNERFTTGEFAALHGINKKTLIFYDEINLFKPDIVKDNGYRLYSYHQSYLMEMILTLKNLGMSLESIRDYMMERSPDHLLTLLASQQEQIDVQISQLNRTKQLLIDKSKTIQENIGIDYDEIHCSQMDEEYIVLSQSIVDLSAAAVKSVVKGFLEKCYLNRMFNYTSGSMIHSERIKNQEFTAYEYIFNKVPGKAEQVQIHHKPKGWYLIAYCKGSWDLLPRKYEAILNYAKENNLTLEGYCYEEGVIDEIAISNNNDYVTKIMIPVSKKSVQD